MPRKSVICSSVLVAELTKFKNEVITQDGRIKPPSDPIWHNISKSFEHKISAKYLYIIFKQNRYDICDKLCLEKFNEEIFEKDESSSYHDEINSSGTSDINSSDESSAKISKREFSIVLSPKEWLDIYPKTVSYQSSERSNRNYNILTPNIWTSIVNEKFFLKTHLPCRLVFKRAKVHPNSDIFVKIFAKCSSCNSIFKAFLEQQPDEFSSAIFICTYKGEFEICQNTKKRPLTGETRKSAVSEICEKNVSSSAYRNEQAHIYMNFGEAEPAHLPTSNALRIMKHREKKKKHENENPIISIHIIMHDPLFNGAIKVLGYDPFNVIYWLPSQMHVYAAYCKENPNSKLSIDATGSIVKKIKRPYKKFSKHIFLYDATVGEQNTNMQYSVCNMLSESHDNHSIYNWLTTWLRYGAPIPKEIVCDQSVALLSGIVRAFSQFQSLKDYVNACFNIIFENSQNIPKTFIRCDVAHTIKMISSWSCLHKKNFRIRNLYIRSLAQAIQSTDINEISDIFQDMITIATSETEGKNASNQYTRCEVAKLKLKDRISFGNVHFNENIEAMIRNNENPDSEDYVKEEGFNNFATWMNYLIQKRKNLQTEEGDHDNMHYLPEICDKFISLSKTLPLWSAVMLPFFKYGDLTASSAAVESNFNDLKNRVFLGKNLPLRADEFIKIHLKSLDGKMKLVAAANQNSRLSTGNNVQNDDKQITSLNKTMQTPNPEISKGTSANEKNKFNSISKCVACANGHLPSGAHKCVECACFIHILEGCSFPISDNSSLEGYGEKRICFKCFSAKNSHYSNLEKPKPTNPIEKNKHNNIPKCVACTNGHLPSGAHKCVKCGCFVHILEGCSFPQSDDSSLEGYGEKRICLKCFSTKPPYNSNEETSKAINPNEKNKLNIPKCVACANGHLPTGAHKCVKCGCFVHILEECSFPLSDDSSLEGYGEKRICSKCLSKKNTHNLNPEDSAFENWRGLIYPPKKRLKSSYLQVQPELSKIDFSSKSTRRPIGLLKNGNLSLKPSKVDNYNVVLTNTCAYDSIFQTLAVAFCDSKAYEDKMKNELENSILKIISDIVSAKITSQTYNLRAALLKSFCKVHILPNSIIQVAAQTTIRQALENVFSEHPSVLETVHCNNVNCGQIQSLKRTVISVIVENNYVSDIEKIILEQLQTSEGVCSKKETDGSLCTGKLISSISVSDKHLFVELLSTATPTIGCLIKDVEFKLNEIQKNINIFGNEYHLRGVISGIKRGESVAEISHYIAVCRRTDEIWEIYDDQQTKKKPCQQQKKITGECLIYTS